MQKGKHNFSNLVDPEGEAEVGGSIVKEDDQDKVMEEEEAETEGEGIVDIDAI